jgi:hypothetical protein
MSIKDDIRRISVLVNDLGDGRDGDAWERLCVVLEAAGKVDKADLLSISEWKLKSYEHTYGDPPENGADNYYVKKDIAWWKMAHDLFAALPGKET